MIYPVVKLLVSNYFVNFCPSLHSDQFVVPEIGQNVMDSGTSFCWYQLPVNITASHSYFTKESYNQK